VTKGVSELTSWLVVAVTIRWSEHGLRIDDIWWWHSTPVNCVQYSTSPANSYSPVGLCKYKLPVVWFYVAISTEGRITRCIQSVHPSVCLFVSAYFNNSISKHSRHFVHSKIVFSIYVF